MQTNSSDNKLLYVAKKSAWVHRYRMLFSIILAALFIICGIALITTPDGVGPGVAAFVIALIFVLIIVLTVVEASKSEIRIYEKCIVTRKGLINVKETRAVMTPIVGVSVEQSFNGRIYNYGNIVIDKMGKGWDIDCTYIKKPEQFKNFLQSLMDKNDTGNITMVMGN